MMNAHPKGRRKAGNDGSEGLTFINRKLMKKIE